MIRKVKIHLVFAVLLFTVYVISCLIYKRSLSDFYKDFLYYLVIAGIVFCINLIKKRKLRWGTFFVGIFAPLTFLIFTGTNAPYTSSLEVLVTALPLDLPFFPNLYTMFKDRVILPVVIYILCFVLPLIYFYAVYALSKMIFSPKALIKK
jgi:hypothetical protein